MVKITREGKNLEFVIVKVHLYSIGKGGWEGEPRNGRPSRLLPFLAISFRLLCLLLRPAVSCSIEPATSVRNAPVIDVVVERPHFVLPPMSVPSSSLTCIRQTKTTTLLYATTAIAIFPHQYIPVQTHSISLLLLLLFHLLVIFDIDYGLLSLVELSFSHSLPNAPTQKYPRKKRNPARSFVQPELGEPVKWSSFQQPQTT